MLSLLISRFRRVAHAAFDRVGGVRIPAVMPHPAATLAAAGLIAVGLAAGPGRLRSRAGPVAPARHGRTRYPGHRLHCGHGGGARRFRRAARRQGLGVPRCRQHLCVRLHGHPGRGQLHGPGLLRGHHAGHAAAGRRPGSIPSPSIPPRWLRPRARWSGSSSPTRTSIPRPTTACLAPRWTASWGRWCPGPTAPTATSSPSPTTRRVLRQPRREETALLHPALG